MTKTEDESRVYNSPHHGNKILLSLYENRHKPHSMCDMMLVAVDQTFPVHRAVVAAASPYLRSILIETMTDGIYSSVLLLSEYIPITSPILELLVSYMYKGSIELHSDNVDYVKEAADTLQMEELKQFCQEYKGLQSSVKKTLPVEKKTSVSRVLLWDPCKRPFLCKYCSQRFPQLDIYKTHYRRHEKIYRKHWLRKFSCQSHQRRYRRPSRYSLRDRSRLKTTGFRYTQDEDTISTDDDDDDVNDEDYKDSNFVIDEKRENSNDIKQSSEHQKNPRCSKRRGVEKSVDQEQTSIPRGRARSCDQMQRRGLLQVGSEDLLYSGQRGSYKCNLCQEQFHLKCDVIKHLATHKPWKCNICNTAFRDHVQLGIHQKVHKELKYKCPLCPRKFNRPRYVSAHLRGHSNPSKIKCSHCNELFRSKAQLETHIEKMHPQSQGFSYGQPNTSRGQLTTPLHGFLHQTERPYRCNQCGLTFKKKYSFLSHEKQAHGRKVYKCDFCHRTFKWRGCLRIHLRRHTGEKPFGCSRCDERFLYKYKLEKHEKNHDTGEVQVVKVTREKEGVKTRSNQEVEFVEIQKHKCDHCEASFLIENDLTDHLRTDHMIQTMPKSLLGSNFFLDDW